MQALQEKQREQQRLIEALRDFKEPTVEERIRHNKDLQYNQNQNLFAVLYSTIHKAAMDNSVSGILWFLQGNFKPRIHVDDFDRFRVCPIHYAAERGADDAVRCLLENHCEVDVKSGDGQTALMYAAKEGRLSTMRLLFEHGASLPAVNRAGMSAAHFAAQSDRVETFALLIELNILLKARLIQEIEEAEIAASDPTAGDKDKNADGSAKKGGGSTVAKPRAAAADDDSVGGWSVDGEQYKGRFIYCAG